MSNRITVPTAAARLGVSRQTVHNMIRAGLLKPVERIGAAGVVLLSADDVAGLAREREAEKSA